MLTSPLLSHHGFVHGFSTRAGGVSEPPFDTMNLARSVGDDPQAVLENYRRFAGSLGIDPSHLFEVDQVHGADVVEVEGGSPEALWKVPADALVTRVSGIAVGVRVADCVPLLLADVRTGAVGAVHAGWRGAAAGVLRRAIDRMTALGSLAADLVVAIGPHISLDAFEVGEEVVQALEASAPGALVVDRTKSKPHVDLASALLGQLREAGVPSANVERVPGCTFGEPARFHSFRRDGRRSGRMLGAIVGR